MESQVFHLEILLIDLLPSSVFLILDIILLIRAHSSQEDQSPEKISISSSFDEKEQESSSLMTISYYVQTKLSILSALLNLFDLIYPFFFSSDDWWIKKQNILVYFYLLAICSWLISSKQIQWASEKYSLAFLNLRIFWIFSFLMNITQLCLDRKNEILWNLILKLFFSLILSFYALNIEEKRARSKNYRPIFYRILDYILDKFEENFYIKIFFLGKDYDKYIKREIELVEIDIHSTNNLNLSFNDVKKKEKGFIKKLNDKNYLNEIEEQEFLTYLPNIQILIWKEPPKTLPLALKNYDPRLFFIVYSYLTWDLDNRMEFKNYKKLSEFMELEKKLNEFYKENTYFNRAFFEFQRVSLDECNKDEDLLYKKRALNLERFFNFVLLCEKHMIHPLILEFLDVNSEEKKPFLSYHNFLIKTRIIRNKIGSKKTRLANSFPNTLESPLLTENIEEDINSQSSISMITRNSLLFEVRLINIWKFPNEPLESNITMGILEKNINYDWEITRKFIDFVNLHTKLKTKPFRDQQDFVKNSQKISPLIEIKSNTYNYFFNFEIIKKEIIDYISFLVSNSTFHCDELFNFIEFDPNAMKRFLLGKNFNKFLVPTQTIRTFTNESCIGGKHQHASILSIMEPTGTNTSFHVGHYKPSSHNNLFSNQHIFQKNEKKIIRRLSKVNSQNYTQTAFARSFTESKKEGNLFERHEILRLENFFAKVGEIKSLNDEKISFVIFLNEFFEENSNKVKRRVIFEKTNFEIKNLYDMVVEFCEKKNIVMSLPLRNSEMFDEENDEDIKNGVEIYLNEVIKLPNISKQKEIIIFFHLDKMKKYFEEYKERELVVFDLRKNV